MSSRTSAYILSSGGQTRRTGSGGIALYSKLGLLGVSFRVKTPSQVWTKEGIEVGIDQWFHIVATWKNGGNMNVYINGTKVDSISSETFTPQAPSVGIMMHAGKPNNGNATTFHSEAAIDEWYVWNSMLSDEHVNQIFHEYFKGKH